jgi:hypothetical protein
VNITKGNEICQEAVTLARYPPDKTVLNGMRFACVRMGRSRQYYLLYILLSTPIVDILQLTYWICSTLVDAIIHILEYAPGKLFF